MSAVAPEASLVATLVGPPGLAIEVLRRLLDVHGVAVAGDGAAPAGQADVAVLVEPLAEHWAEVQGRGLPIVLVTDEEVGDDAVVDAALAGADAVLHCDSSQASVIDALDAVRRGGSLFAPATARVLAGLARAAAARPVVALSRREAEILDSIARGHAVKQTARELCISAKTVENLQGRLFRKLGVRNRAQAVARAHGLGLL
jgi:DNA-binding NarL/FixJ family response regulator